MVQVKTSACKDLYASLSACTSASLPCNSTHTDDPGQLSLIREIVTKFVKSLEYCPEEAMKETRTTYQSLCSEFFVYNDGRGWFEPMCLQSSTMGEVGHSFRCTCIKFKSVEFTAFLPRPPTRNTTSSREIYMVLDSITISKLLLLIYA